MSAKDISTARRPATRGYPMPTQVSAGHSILPTLTSGKWQMEDGGVAQLTCPAQLLKVTIAK